MKSNIRWQIGLAVAGLLLVAGILYAGQRQTSRPLPQVESIDTPEIEISQEGDACFALLPAAGGVLVEGVVGRPRTPNPILSDANPVDRDIAALLFDGLTRYAEDGRLVPALASGWEVSDDGLTVTFTLREDAVWHDGTPVTAADVVYTYSLFKAEDFPLVTPDLALWRTIEIVPVDERQVAFTLANPYSPFLEATTRGLLPSHLLEGVSAAALGDHPFNAAPVGTGPFRAVGDWIESGFLTLAPVDERAFLDGIVYRFYATEEALWAAYEAGDVQALSRITEGMLPTAVSRPELDLYTAPRPRYTQLLFNQSESGHPALRELEVRQALSSAIDRNQLIDVAALGQGLIFEGPYLSSSFAYDPNLPTPLNTNREAATQQLGAAGWNLADDGATVRTKSLSEEGEPVALALRLLVLDEPDQIEVGEALISQLNAVGIELFLITADLPTFNNTLKDRAYDMAVVEIVPPQDPDLYDFWSQEAIVSGQNFAGWNNRRASEALEAARQVWNQDERRSYYGAFLQFYADQQPALTLFQLVDSYAISDAVQGVNLGRIDSPRDRYFDFNRWYYDEIETQVPCPEA